MIDISEVSRRYGSVMAIDGLTVQIPDNKICCLLGRNGAGKTTLMNLIAGRISASAGEVRIDGTKVDTLHMPENVEYIATATKQFNMRLGDLIRLAAGVSEDFDMEFALRMAEKFRLDQRKKYNHLSLGMKTMAATLISLASRRKMVLLDEPVLGLDAIMRAEFYELLQESFSRQPRTLIISTHLIDEIANIVQQVILIDQGRLVFSEEINTINEKAYQITGIREDVEAASAGLNVISRRDIGKYESVCVFDRRIAPSERVEVTNLSLQELFIKQIGGTEHE